MGKTYVRVQWALDFTSWVSRLILNLILTEFCKCWHNRYQWVFSSLSARTCSTHVCHFYPVPDRGMCFCFRWISFFVSLFVSLSARLRENGWTDLHEIFREGVEWQWDDLIQFWVSSDKRVGGSKVKLFVVTGHSSDCCHLANDSDLLTQVTVIRSRGQGLLCLTPQLILEYIEV